MILNADDLFKGHRRRYLIPPGMILSPQGADFSSPQWNRTVKEMTDHDLRTAFREILDGKTCKKAASVFDPISVRMATDLGFEVAILGGSVASLQVLGAPDISLLTLNELAEQAARLGRASHIPVIADADHGYGDALNVMRTVTELQKAGVAALTLEDTHLLSKYSERSLHLISIEEAIGKIYAARAARSDSALALIARTHVGASTLADATARVMAYQKAGADAICLVGVTDYEHLQALTADLSLPIMLINYGDAPLIDGEKLVQANVRVVVNGHAPYLSALKATYEALCLESPVNPSTLALPDLVSRYSLSDRYAELAEAYVRAGTGFN